MANLKRVISPSYGRNIPYFLIYRFLYNFMLFLPVWVIFMQDKFGLNLTQVTLNDSAFWLSMALSEVPTGAVADTWGRKHSQVIGMVIATGSILMFALAPVYPLVLVANSFWAVGITFISGADIALLYDTLRELGREDEYPRYRGQLQAIQLSSIALSSVFGGIIGEFSLVSTFTLTAGVMVLATGFLLLLKEPPREPDQVTGTSLSYWEILKVTLKTIRDQPTLRYALSYSALTPLLGATIRVTFIQPYAIGIGLPIASLGMIALGLRAFQFIGSLNALRITKRFGERRWLWIAVFLMTAGVIALGAFNSIAGILFFALTGFASAVTVPLIERIIMKQTPGSVRATILSVDSLFFRVLLALVGPMIGLIGDQNGIPASFVYVGLGFGVALLVLLSIWGHVRRNSVFSTPPLSP